MSCNINIADLINEKQCKLKKIYNNVIAQAISESGYFMFAGSRFGDIFVIDIEELQKTEEPRSKLRIWSLGESVEINSMLFHRDCLVIGGVGSIFGLQWDEKNRVLNTKRKYEIKMPMDVSSNIVPDVNSLWLRPGTDYLYAGCGNNMTYQISLENGSIVREYKGHTDYIHCVTGFADGRIFTASEDGTVRLWSENEKYECANIVPHHDKNLVRPDFGNWIGAVAVSGDWLVCGGGPHFSMWHLNSLALMHQLPFPGKVHVCDFIEDSILCAGEHKEAHLYNLIGNMDANIQLDCTATYSAVWQLEPIKFMSTAGFSNKLHIFKDFHYIDSTLEMYGNDTDHDENEHF